MTPNPAPTAPAQAADPETQRRDLLDAQRRANQHQPRNFKEDALHDKVVHMEPDDTGPTPTETFDPVEDRHTGEARTAESPSAEDHPAGTRARPTAR